MPKDTYVIPLKGICDHKPRTKRAKYAIREIYRFLKKHTRKDKEDILISSDLNSYIWKNGIQKPPRKVKVSLKITKDKVFVSLFDSSKIQKKKKIKNVPKPKEEKSKKSKEDTKKSKKEESKKSKPKKKKSKKSKKSKSKSSKKSKKVTKKTKSKKAKKKKSKKASNKKK